MIRTLRYEEPIAVLGDIHGRLDLLEPLLERLGDRPVLTAGDVADRGANARGVIEHLIARGVTGVQGNHEEWFLSWVQGRGFDTFVLSPQFGADATLSSYEVRGRTVHEVESQRWRVPAHHREWLESLALVVDLHVMGEPYWLTHGGIPSFHSFEGLTVDQVVPWLVEHHPRDILWAGTEPEYMLPIDRTVIMGHMAIPEPLDMGHVLALDTGAGTFGIHGALTAVLLPERTFVSEGPLEPPPWLP